MELLVGVVLFVGFFVLISRINAHPYGYQQRVSPPRHKATRTRYVATDSQPSASVPNWEHASPPPFIRHEAPAPRISRASYAAQFAADAQQAMNEQSAKQAESLAKKMALATAILQERQHRHEDRMRGIIDGQAKRIE